MIIPAWIRTTIILAILVLAVVAVIDPILNRIFSPTHQPATAAPKGKAK